jgi:NAD(P)-dependent dehydrogenase (short-subunit alcohol dehydrogenase family)
VSAHYNRNSASLDPLVAEFGDDRVQKVQADLGVEASVIQVFRDLAKGKLGPVQVAIVNHAVSEEEDVPVSRMSLERWEYTIKNNLTSPFLVTREYLKGLESLGEDPKGLKDKAAIIFIGSTAGKRGEAGHAEDAAAKGGEAISSGGYVTH